MLEQIKLIIWDLDDTLWEGTLSEEDVELNDDNRRFVANTSDMGIIHSICSKNDFTKASDKLKDLNCWDYFVFPSIDWSAKGARVKHIIDTMNLRTVNVLFIDDNIQNIEEVKHSCAGIKTTMPQLLSDLYKEAIHAEKSDLQHKRLKSYRILEKKEVVKQSFLSNEDFLKSCQIRVSINKDCIMQIDRIHDLITRSNQLNYTKNRQNINELRKILEDKNVNSGYVSVKDKFGDYGIVGFYAVKNNTAIHFAFSCRTLGMLIEQYVYITIGCPNINVVGDVVTVLNKTMMPAWINRADSNAEQKKLSTSSKILLKGPCDMSQIFSFICENDNIETEFSYTNDKGILIEGYNHTAQIVTALFSSKERKREIINDEPFFDSDMLDTKLLDNNLDFVVLSLLSEASLGVYQRKSTGEYVSFCEKYYDLTDSKNTENYILHHIFTSNIKFSKDELNDFSSKYRFVKDENFDLTIKNLGEIRKFLKPECKLILLLGSERAFLKHCKDSYVGRHILHRTLNDKVRTWIKNQRNIILVELDDYIKSDSDFGDTINHFSKRIYFDLANYLVIVFNDNRVAPIKVRNKLYLLFSIFKQKIRVLKSKLFN